MGLAASAAGLHGIIPALAVGVATLRARKVVYNILAKVRIKYYVEFQVGDARFNINHQIGRMVLPRTSSPAFSSTSSSALSSTSGPKSSAERRSEPHKHCKVRLQYHFEIMLGKKFAATGSKSDRCSQGS